MAAATFVERFAIQMVGAFRFQCQSAGATVGILVGGAAKWNLRSVA